MIWLLWLGLAWAEPSVDVDAQRLLGSDEEASGAELDAPPAPELPGGLWLWMIPLLGAGATWAWLRHQRSAVQGEGPSLRVVERTALGREGGLAVVEVRDAEGSWRRILLGTGGGAPQLVCRLDASPFATVMEEVVAEPLPAPRVRKSEPGRVAATDEELRPLPPSGDARLRQGRELIDEVRARRGRQGRYV